MNKVRVHRNLNTKDDCLWVITKNGKIIDRLNEFVMRVDRIIVSDRTILRCRTPKDKLTALGTKGIGRRTVCAWFEGNVYKRPSINHAQGIELHFNPMKDWIHWVRLGGWKRNLDMDCSDFYVNFNQHGAFVHIDYVHDIIC